MVGRCATIGMNRVVVSWFARGQDYLRSATGFVQATGVSALIYIFYAQLKNSKWGLGHRWLTLLLLFAKANVIKQALSWRLYY